MKHATPATLSTIETLLRHVRSHPNLTERKPGIFYRKSVAFLHFHEDPAGLFADLKGPSGFDRFPANSAAKRTRLLREVASRLAS